MTQTLPWHDESIINAIIYIKNLKKKKENTTLETYHNAVRHATGSAVFHKQNLLFASCNHVLIHV